MKYCNKSFESEAELKNFISECENDFEFVPLDVALKLKRIHKQK